MKIEAVTYSREVVCSEKQPFISAQEKDKTITMSVRSDAMGAVVEVVLTEVDLAALDAFRRRQAENG